MNKAKFSEVQKIDRSKISLDAKTFQGRQVKFSEETVNKIVREGFDLTDDPIVVWRNPAGKYLVISGHSRFEASERLYKAGDKRLKTMPVKIFNGTKEQAADFAVFESNRSGTAEGLKSDLQAYKRAVAKGYNRAYLQGIFKPDSYLNLLQKLSYLSLESRFLEYIGTTQEKSFPYLRRNAEWVGTLKQMYTGLTGPHENEIFNYLYKTRKGLTVSKQQLFDLMEKKAGNMFFDATKPLNLENVASKSTVTREGDEAIREKEREIDKLRAEREKKMKTLSQARRESNKAAETNLTRDIAGIDAATLKALAAIDHLKNGLREANKAAAFDLFSAPENRIELKFSTNKAFRTENIEIWGLARPSTELRAKLQKNGFKWSPWNRVWFKKDYSDNDLTFARSIAEKSIHKPEKIKV